MHHFGKNRVRHEHLSRSENSNMNRPKKRFELGTDSAILLYWILFWRTRNLKSDPT